MKQFLKKNVSLILLVLIICISMAGILFWGQKKEGYHIDEIYSYGLSNSEYLPFMHMGYHDYNVKDWMKEYGAGRNPVELIQNLIKDFKILKSCNFQFKNSEIYGQYLRAQANSADVYATSWMTGQDYKDYLTAGNGNRFNLASVYYNQRGDVHPPLFYLLLHGICSIVTGSYSKWLGIGLNMVLLAGAMLALYVLIRKYIGGVELALTAVACYGFARGFMTTALLIRMYSLFTLMVVLSCLVHLKIVEEGYEFTKKNRRFLFFVTLFGFLSHYYFVLFAIAITVVVSAIMIIRKQWKQIIRFWTTLALSAVVGLCVWPFAIKHVFGGYRGQDALGKFKSGLFHPAYVYVVLEQVVTELFGGHWEVFLFPILAVVVFIMKAVRKKTFTPKTVQKVCVIYIPVIIYFMAVTQIVPMLIDRYVMCVYPFIMLSVVWGAGYLLRELFRCGLLQKKFAALQNEKKFITVGIGMAGLVITLMGCWFWRTPGYLFTQGQLSHPILNGSDCVYVLPDGSWNASGDGIPYMAQCNRVLVTHEGNVEELCKQYVYKAGTPIVVGVYRGADSSATKDKVLQAMNATGLEVQDIWAWAGTEWFQMK